MYLDDNGDEIFVRSGIGEGAYKAFRRKINPKSGNYKERGLQTVEYKKRSKKLRQIWQNTQKRRGGNPSMIQNKVVLKKGNNHGAHYRQFCWRRWYIAGHKGGVGARC